MCHFVYDDEETCLAEVRYLLSMLPQNNREAPPAVRTADPASRRGEMLLDHVPADGSRPYDMTAVIGEIVDDGEYLEVHEHWARNIVCALARLDGQVVGIVANQPRTLAGVLDIHASEKAARFVQMCDAFNIPLVTLLDVPGFLPGVGQEHGGIIRHGAKLLYAYCSATVPRISLILRKAYGGAYIVMDSQSIGADLTYAWPANEIAVMGAEGAAGVIFRRRIAEAADPEAMRQKLVKEYRAELMHPYYAAERGLVDDVIDPAATREVLIRSLAMLHRKHADLPSRKHGNPPRSETGVLPGPPAPAPMNSTIGLFTASRAPAAAARPPRRTPAPPRARRDPGAAFPAGRPGKERIRRPGGGRGAGVSGCTMHQNSMYGLVLTNRPACFVLGVPKDGTHPPRGRRRADRRTGHIGCQGERGVDRAHRAQTPPGPRAAGPAHPDRVVPVAALVDELWSGRPRAASAPPCRPTSCSCAN